MKDMPKGVRSSDSLSIIIAGAALRYTFEEMSRFVRHWSRIKFPRQTSIVSVFIFVNSRYNVVRLIFFVS